MKDWYLDTRIYQPYGRGRDRPSLMHRCSSGTLEEPKYCYAERTGDGTWCCFNCDAEAPEEIGFIADLAGCWED